MIENILAAACVIMGIVAMIHSSREEDDEYRKLFLIAGAVMVIAAPLALVFDVLSNVLTAGAFVGACYLLYRWYQRTVEDTKKKVEDAKPTPPPEPVDHTEAVAFAVETSEAIPIQWREPLAACIRQHGYYLHEEASLSYLTDVVGYLRLSRYQPGGQTKLLDLANALPKDDGSGMRRSLFFKLAKFGDGFSTAVLNLGCHFALPETVRTQHHHIVAGTGAGKSQCIQQLVSYDLETDASIVVIDSQDDLINTIATRVPTERLILIDPAHCPPALNIFSTTSDVSTATELFEYIFAALDSKMTTKQATAYRFVSRLLMAIPGANIHTMREILEPGQKHQEYVEGLGDTVRSFFENEYNGRQFAETRSQILGRLYTVLENETFERMLSATSSNLDIPSAIAEGKVILVNTAKAHLKQTAASLLGRIFIAQVMQAVMGRTNRKRTYMYIDEFQDYAEDSHVLFNLFEQARKYELGLIVAHQYLGQLPPQLLQSLSANTAIKFASKVSAQDARTLAAQMQTTPDFIEYQSPGSFAAYIRGIGTLAYSVELGRMERMPKISELSAIRENMRRAYGLPSPTQRPKKTLNLKTHPRRGRRED